MPEIPKSARELLARQTAPEVHPSPDLLNAYVEQALSGAEKDNVTEHLAACADCRDVVFLASQSQEQEEEVELPFVATATRAQQAMDAMPLPACPRRRHRRWLRSPGLFPSATGGSGQRR